MLPITASPTDENTFGRKGGFVKLTFGEDSLSINKTVCKKL